ncbi:serine hydrolase, partial [Staphylococcus aureus]
PDVHFANYGLGWFLASYKGHYRVEHGGNINGFSASTSFFPTDSVGIIVLTNQDGSSIPSIVRNIIADRVLNLPYFD